MKEKENNKYLIWLIGLIFLLVIIIYNLNLTIEQRNYGLNPSNKDYNEYTSKHPIVTEIKPFHPNIKNNIKIREFVAGTNMFYGELDGYGRTPFAYAGLANNPVDQEIIKNLVKESLDSYHYNNKRKIRMKIDSLLSSKVYKGKNRKERTINEIIKLIK